MFSQSQWVDFRSSAIITDIEIDIKIKINYNKPIKKWFTKN